LHYPLTYRMLRHISLTLLEVMVLFLVLCRCSSTRSEQRFADGTIGYPFIQPQKKLGRDPDSNRFVIKSAVGQTEYSVEIPEAGDGYDIQIPIAALNPQMSSDAMAVGAKSAKVPNPVATDKELTRALPSITKASPEEVATMDAAMGVGSPEGPVQSPSYSLGIAKVNTYFKERNYELALMEINNLISFYPNSPKLLKMKGTLLIKTGNHELAMKSWQRALDLAPTDKSLTAAVRRLQDRMTAMKDTNPQPPTGSDATKTGLAH
jgi:tetratricopeptide (TPR) repeat protein